jgi:hypothetical protein
MAGWNWAAALLSMFWLLYRRMHKEFWIVMGILVVWGMVEGLLRKWPAAGGATRSIERFGNFVFAAVMGMIGNGLYLRRSGARCCSRGACSPRVRRATGPTWRSAGGTSWTAALIGVAVLACVAVLGAMLAGPASWV